MSSAPLEPSPPAAPARRGSAAILAAAEQLFGEFGIDGISTRRIIHAAGMVNNSAVIYHFGDRAGLLRALFEWRAAELEASASALYTEAEARDLLSDPAALLGVMLRPYLHIRDEKGRYSHVAFMYQALRSPEARDIRSAILPRFVAISRALHRLVDALPGIPSAVIMFRLRLAAIMFFDGMIEQDRSPQSLDLPPLPDEVLVRELLAGCTAMLTAPVDPELARAAS